MRKLLIAMSIACVAAFARSATYDWTIMGYATPNGVDGGELTGAKIYGFDANVYTVEAIAAKLMDSSVGADALSLALNYGEIDDGAYYEAIGSGLTDNAATKGAEDPLQASMFALIVAKDEMGKDWFYTATFDPVDVTEAVVGGGAIFEPDIINTGAIGAEGWTAVASAVPEPTSGLLLLLGVGALALRRRRA